MIELKKNTQNEYHFFLTSASGHILLKSVSFSTKEAANSSLENLASEVQKPGVFERKTNHNGQFLFNFKNTTGQLIGSSQLYNSEAGMENGIKNLKKRISTLANLG